jgi:hypothetical protein
MEVTMYKIHQLDSEEFPMLFAFYALNGTLSCSGQSAPGCNAEWSKDKWQEVENNLAVLPANLFVGMGLGSSGPWPREFAEFEKAWE